MAGLKRRQTRARFRPWTTAGLGAVLLCAIGACAPDARVQVQSAPYPELLSTWGILDHQGERLVLATDSLAYDLNSALFSDYASKLRTLHVPAGEHARYHATDAFDMPEGTVISKTFFYRQDADGVLLETGNWSGYPPADGLPLKDVRLIETRLLVKTAESWDALPYIWQGNDARLAITGDLLSLPVSGREDALHYLVPSRNQCASCHAWNHTTGAIEPLGIKARHLNKTSGSMVSGNLVSGNLVSGNKVADGSETSQLAQWAHRDWLTGLPAPQNVPANAAPNAPHASLAHRARSYLDINCGHCHNPVGAADTSGLLLDYADHDVAALGVCKPPVAAGRGSGGRLYSIVPGDPGASIMTFRLASNDPASMMPELGRSVAHAEGVALVSDWIASLGGVCR